MEADNSVAAGQFPLMVWREGERRLWNPIHRQALKNLPEERVRLRVLEYLLHGGWSRHRISTEEAIDLPRNEAALRTDLICYTRAFKPRLLVECKAENVQLSAATAEQIARYNQKVQAPLLLITNGRTDYWYQNEVGRAARPVTTLPDLLPQDPVPADLNFDYWHRRAFAGGEADPPLRRWLHSCLAELFAPDQATGVRYLSFNSRPGDTDLSHYYCTYSFDDCRLALSFIDTPYGGSRMIAILNREGRNEAVAEINLDLLFAEQSPNTTVFRAGGPDTLDIGTHLPDIRSAPFTDAAPLAELLRRLTA